VNIPGFEIRITPTLTLTLSPGEREQRATIASFLAVCRTNSNLRFAEGQRMILPLLGERAGVRASVCLISLLLFSATLVHAQSYSIDWHTIDGGGGASTGSVYAVSGTIGQPDASGPLNGGTYTLVGGFWALPSAVQTVGAPTLTIAPAGPGQATISWTPATAGFVLQENLNLGTTNWVNSASGATNSVTVPVVPPRKFYRLFKP